MDVYESEEWNFEDNEIYENLKLDDIPTFLINLGYNTRKIGFKYLSYDHYKHIFHFSLACWYNEYNIFTNLIMTRPYYSYNNIMINNHTNIQNTARFLIDMFNLTKDTLCIFVDIRDKDNSNRHHTTLLIYRKNINTIEYFDSNGIGGYGYTFKLKKIMDIVVKEFPGITSIKSKELNGLESYSISEASIRSLNALCGISKSASIGGWCQIWSLFIYEMICKFPKEKTKYIIQVVYSMFKDYNYKDASLILNNLMRGFYRIILGRTNMILREIKGNNSLHIKAEILSEYSPDYVVNDIELENVINNEMLPRSLLDGFSYNMIDI